MNFTKMSSGLCFPVRYSILAGLVISTQTALVYPVQAVEMDVQKRIDKQEENCLKKDSSTAGCVNCAEQTYKEWDRQLNIYYTELIELLEPAQKAELKKSQLNWLKFRDGEFKQIESLFSTLEGTMYIPMQVESRVRIVRDRALQLISYYRLFAEDEEPAPVPRAKRARDTKPHTGNPTVKSGSTAR
jgi:uncharacterized protein YecT (DUF1311 family)